MAEQLSLGAVATGQPLSVVHAGAACTLPFEHWRELDAITAHGPEARVRAWATKHRVKLWEGQLQ